MLSLTKSVNTIKCLKTLNVIELQVQPGVIYKCWNAIESTQWLTSPRGMGLKVGETGQISHP